MNKVASLDLTKNQTCFIVVVLSIKFVNYFRKLFYENLRQLLPTVISNECKWPTETSWSEIDKRKELKSSNTKNGNKFKIIYLSHHHVLCFFSKTYILWFLKTSRDVKARIKKNYWQLLLLSLRRLEIHIIDGSTNLNKENQMITLVL